MPLPKAIAKSNRYVVNPIARQFAGKLAPFAIIEHRGRSSGDLYRTPVALFPVGERFLLALTYGVQTDWVQNIQANGGCSVEYRQKRMRLVNPEPISGEAAEQPLPRWVRIILQTVGVRDFLQLEKTCEEFTQSIA